MNRDNPQGTPSQAEIAWLAGFIEGEGTLVLSSWKRNEKQGKQPKIGLQVKIYNTDALLIRRTVDMMERMGVAPHIKEREQKPMLRPGGGEYRPVNGMYIVTINKLEQVHQLLTHLHPWLAGDKRARADLMLRFLDRRFAKFRKNNGYKRVPYDDGDMQIVAEFYGLTSRGSSVVTGDSSTSMSSPNRDSG